MQGNQLSFAFTLLKSTLSSLQTAMCYVAAGGPKEYAIIFSSAEHQEYLVVPQEENAWELLVLAGPSTGLACNIRFLQSVKMLGIVSKL